jgi:hypothetical protein
MTVYFIDFANSQDEILEFMFEIISAAVGVVFIFSGIVAHV